MHAAGHLNNTALPGLRPRRGSWCGSGGLHVCAQGSRGTARAPRLALGSTRGSPHSDPRQCASRDPINSHSASRCASLFICPAPFVVCELLHGHGYVLFKFAFSFFREMPGAHTVLDECWADRGAPSGQERTAGRRRPLSLGLCCGVDRSLARSLNIDGAPARPQASRPWESERHLRLGEESSSRNGAPVPSLSHSRRRRRGAEWRTLKAQVPGGTFPWPRGFSRPSPAPWAGPSLISFRRRKAGTPLPALTEAATGRCRCTAARGQVQGARSRGETHLGRRRPARCRKGEWGSWSPRLPFLPKGPDAHRRPLPVPGEDKLRPPPVPKPVLFKSLKLMCFMDS